MSDRDHCRETIGIILFDDVEEMDFVGPYEMLGVWSRQYGGPSNLITISENAVIRGSHGLKIMTDYGFSNCPSRIDYLVIPGGKGTRSQAHNLKLIEFLKTARNKLQCKFILSVCTGSFLLQKAGLLKGLKATTHWASLDRLRGCNDVDVVEQRVVRNEYIWTSSGISSGIDLALQFISFIDGEDVAGKVQLYAEYFPFNKVYGDAAVKESRSPKYVRSKL